MDRSSVASRGTSLVAALTLIAAVLALSAVPGASAAQRPTGPELSLRSLHVLRPPRDDNTATAVEIGPLGMRAGWTVQITVGPCGARQGDAMIVFDRWVGAGAEVSHTYSGGRASCTAPSATAPGTLIVSWGDVAAIKMTFVDTDTSGAGTSLCNPVSSVGIRATGAVVLAIHPRVFGAVRVASVKGDFLTLNEGDLSAILMTVAGQACGGSGGAAAPETDLEIMGPGPSNGTPNWIIGGDSQGDQREAGLLDYKGDRIASGISSTFELDVTRNGAGPFAADKSLLHAQITMHDSEVHGTIRFAGLAECPGMPDARNGTVSGSLTVTDPVLGRVVFAGDRAVDAALSVGNGQPGGCNGIGKIAPKLANTCGKRSYRCSRALGRSDVTFVDETFTGTERVESETVSFGDGTAPVRITLDGDLTHRYRRPGRYVATLTLRGSAGTRTGRTVVYITS